MTTERKVTLDYITPSQVVYVSFVAPNNGTVEVNFNGDADNIVFHTSIRYAGNDFVWNTKTHGVGWGIEERPSGFIFAHEQVVVLRYEIDADWFNVCCNGNKLGAYAHRMSVSKIKSVSYRAHDNGGNVATAKARLMAIEVKY